MKLVKNLFLSSSIMFLVSCAHEQKEKPFDSKHVIGKEDENINKNIGCLRRRMDDPCPKKEEKSYLDKKNLPKPTSYPHRG